MAKITSPDNNSDTLRETIRDLKIHMVILVKFIISKLLFGIITRFFTIPSLFIILSLYIYTFHRAHSTGIDFESDYGIFGQTANYILGDRNFVSEYTPRIWLALVALISVIESIAHRIIYSKKLSFPRFLIAYKSLLIMIIPLWVAVVSLVYLNLRALVIVPIYLVTLVLLWPLLNAEYALYVVTEKYLSGTKLSEKHINQKARAPWVAMKDLWAKKPARLR